MDKSSMSPEESLAMISRAISNLKINYRASAGIFLFWGWMLTLASLSNFMILKILGKRELYGQMGFYSLGNWMAFFLIGLVILLFMRRKSPREKRASGYLESSVKNIWWGAVISFAVAILLCFRLEINPPPLMLLIAGFATTATGLTIRSRALSLGGASYFILSILSSFVNSENIALIVAAAIVCGYLVPGYILKSAKPVPDVQ